MLFFKSTYYLAHNETCSIPVSSVVLSAIIVKHFARFTQDTIYYVNHIPISYLELYSDIQMLYRLFGICKLKFNDNNELQPQRSTAKSN